MSERRLLKFGPFGLTDIDLVLGVSPEGARALKSHTVMLGVNSDDVVLADAFFHGECETEAKQFLLDFMLAAL